MTIEEMEKSLEKILDELPKEFYDGLNGGVILSTLRKKQDKVSERNDLYVLGEYQRSQFQKQIVIYYGSFLAVYGSLSNDALEQKLRETIRHEFRHHLETRSGFRDLEVEDEIQLEQFRQKSDSV